MKAFKIPSIFTAIDKITAPVRKMQDAIVKFANRSETEVAKLDRVLRRVSTTAFDVSKKSAIVGLAIAAPLIFAGHKAIAFEDRMADVAKTTGLAGKELDALGAGILMMDTRTSKEQLQVIAAIGGSLGIAKKEMLGFTDSANKFNVALGSDFGSVDAAVKKIGGLKVLFKETRDIRIDEAITKAGSAINALSAKGVVVPELTEFISRVGQLPDAIKPSLQNVAALGAVFNKAGITAEIASRAFGDILLTGAQNLPKFAKQMGITASAAQKLINSDPTTFALKFSESLNGLSAEKLAKTLKALKLSDVGAIKAVGSLASSSKMLAEFQAIANTEFAKGTSLLDEYNTKNNTTAAKIARAANSAEAFAIILGQELLPMINDVLMKVLPLAKAMIAWARDNKGTVKTILAIAIGASALSFAISGVAFAVGVVSKVMMIWNNIGKAVTAVQWAWNLAMSMNPIGLIVIGVAALIGVVALIINKWNEWGAVLSIFLGPLGLVISMIQSFRRNWDMITDAFTKGGIVAGLKAIGATILDALLMPLQQVVKLIGNITGAQWAKDLDATIQGFRTNIGVNTTTDESGEPLARPAINPKTAADPQTFNSTLTIHDVTGRGKMDNENPMISLMPVYSGTR